MLAPLVTCVEQDEKTMKNVDCNGDNATGHTGHCHTIHMCRVVCIHGHLQWRCINSCALVFVLRGVHLQTKLYIHTSSSIPSLYKHINATCLLHTFVSKSREMTSMKGHVPRSHTKPKKDKFGWQKKSAALSPPSTLSSSFFFLFFEFSGVRRSRRRRRDYEQ